jgi:hypothetical protein
MTGRLPWSVVPYKYNRCFRDEFGYSRRKRSHTDTFFRPSRLSRSFIMHFSQVLALASSAALVAAAPAPITVGVDDVILYGKNGRFTMMKRDEFDELKKLRESGVVPPMPSYLDDSLITLPANESAPSKPQGSLKKRATSLIIPNPHSRFLGWDVQTSQVVKGEQIVDDSSTTN